MNNKVLKELLAHYRGRVEDYDKSVKGIGCAATQPADLEAKEEWVHTVWKRPTCTPLLSR